jgi:hypothetical protein
VIIKSLKSTYKLKPSSIGPPDQYLGSQIKKFYIQKSDEPGKVRWSMSSEKYTTAAIRDVETELEKVDKQLTNTISTPMASGYHAELDATKELDSRRSTFFMGLIGILR